MRKPYPELLLASGAVVAFVAVLWGLEHLLRLGDPHYLDRVRGETVYSEDYGWKLRPGFQGLLHDVPTTVNAKAYRGREHAYEKTPGRTRVVMLGDSVAFGAKVRDEQTFSALLESRGGHFDVVNLAVEGYGTDQELILLEREGLRYRPDVVILNFCVSNDVLNNSLSWNAQDEQAPKPYFSWDGTLHLHDGHVRLSPVRSAKQWLADDSHLYQRLSALLPGSREPTGRERNDAGEPLDTPAAVELSFRLIRRLDDVTRHAGARFLVLLHPDQPAFRQDSRILKKFCKTRLLEGIPVVDLGERYRVRGLGWDEISLDYQGHLTPRGHQVATQVIETLLAEPLSALHEVVCPEEPR